MLKAKKGFGPRVTKRQLKEDQFITKIFEFYDLAIRYQREILYAVIAVIAVVLIGYWIAQDKVASEQNAAIEFSRGKMAYETQNYDEAIDILTALTQNFDGTKSAGVGVIYLGKAYRAKKDYANQEQYFQIYLDDYDDDDLLSVAATRGVAASFDERGEYLKAAGIYEKGAARFHDGYNAPLFLLDAARCYILAGETAKAKTCLEEIINDYEKSPVLPEAKRILAEKIE